MCYDYSINNTGLYVGWIYFFLVKLYIQFQDFRPVNPITIIEKGDTFNKNENKRGALLME